MPATETDIKFIYFIKRVLFGGQELISINKETRGLREGRHFLDVEVLESLLRELPDQTYTTDYEKKFVSEEEALELLALVSDEPAFDKHFKNIFLN